MSLIDAFNELSRKEREEYERLKADLPAMSKIVGWLVRQQGGHVRIPQSIFVTDDRELLVERADHKNYLVLRSR